MDHFHRCFTERADKNFQQLGINRHGGNRSTGTPRSIPWGWSNQESEISKLDGFLHLKSESGNLKLDPWFEIRSQAPRTHSYKTHVLDRRPDMPHGINERARVMTISAGAAPSSSFSGDFRRSIVPYIIDFTK